MIPSQKEQLTSEPAINGLLEANRKSLKALVTKSGQIYYVKAACPPRAFRELVNETRALVGDLPPIAISPVEYERWEHQKNDRAAQTPAREPGKENTTLGFIFDQAIRDSASDVYLTIKREEARVEFKSHGVKYPVDTLAREQAWALANILWSSVCGQYDKTLPCDISVSHDHQGKTYRIRANSVPTSDGGNTIACRIRDPKLVMPLHTLGYSDQQIAHLRDICMAPGGLILFTGPTNSGKSTSVTSIMNDTPPSEHMIEVADPVEIELDHCTHMEIDRYHQDHEEIFNRTLSSLVRQNPDVLVLGEIRDHQTAEAAVNMAVQGKRVLSTLHSTSASSVFTRLHGLGVPDHVLALPEFMAGVVCQSLVPIPCRDCSIDHQGALQIYPIWQMAHIEEHLDTAALRYLNKEGCSQCLHGIAGQTLVAEVFPLIRDAGPVFEMIDRKQFYRLPKYMFEEHGVISKPQHARTKVMAGKIDPISTLRIVGSYGKAVQPKSLPATPRPRFRKKQEIDARLQEVMEL